MKNELGKAVDAWFEAIPEDVYAPCPCGCGKKWKFAKEQPEIHEQTFVENYLKTHVMTHAQENKNETL